MIHGGDLQVPYTIASARSVSTTHPMMMMISLGWMMVIFWILSPDDPLRLMIPVKRVAYGETYHIAASLQALSRRAPDDHHDDDDDDDDDDVVVSLPCRRRPWSWRRFGVGCNCR
jgi:hypothetical protein